MVKNKFIFFIIFLLFVSLLFITCKKSGNEETIVEIRDRLFISQVNDVYLNSSDYFGKKIKLEGIYNEEMWRNSLYRSIVRYGPGGCCGNDANVGFEVRWPQNSPNEYPGVDSWVEATGILRFYFDHSERYIYLDLISLDVKNQRGMEYVSQ